MGAKTAIRKGERDNSGFPTCSTNTEGGASASTVSLIFSMVEFDFAFASVASVDEVAGVW